MVQRFEMLQKQTQQMILSPQMLQAIHMLQMPLMELQALVQQEITLNPVLEETMEQEKPTSETPEPEKETKAEEHESELDFKEEFDNLTKLDDEWKDYFAQSGNFRKLTQQDEEKRKFMLESVTTGESLHDHLLWQLGLIALTPEKKALGETIIGNIDENGYLRTASTDLVAESGKSIEEIEETISLIQSFNPVGVGSRDIKECLLIQLDRLGKANTLETKIVENYLDLVAEQKYKPIADALQVPEENVKNAVDLITTLDPKPGLLFSQEHTQYIEPDVFVEKIDGEYVVTLNDARIPHLFISNLYRDLMQRKDTSQETKEYIRNKVTAGNWLIRNILQRQQTVNKIANEIVRVQREFLEEGPSFIKPLTMQEVANAVNLHESTISRAIANKYIQTPQGTFQLKYFFSAGVQTESGESISIANLKERVDGMIKEENHANPLSDQEILEKLSAQGIKIARRTIAKYRHEMGIPASSLRKKAS
jgi:RNA polymerase sigma-54 factor